MEEQEKKRMGRPPENISLYDKYVAGKEEEIEQACEKGADLKGLANLLGCGLTTLKRIKKAHPEFVELIKVSSEVADDEVVSALYKRALGYDVEETVTEVKVSPSGAAQTTYVKKVKKHVPPDTTAMIFWLKNRTKEWSDRQDVNIDTTQPINITIAPYKKKEEQQNTENE
ncbi:MAG: hypothetical protein IJY03_04755 [Prevotella sp.]|nr:hypothetical protein [Prevotella sp.]